MPETLSNPYCTVAEVQAEIRNSDSSLTDQLTRAINAASRWIDAQQGRDYYQHDHTSTPLVIDEFDHCAVGCRLFLPYWPVISITTVELAGETLVKDTDYSEREDMLVYLLGEWPRLYRPDGTLKLYGKFGYAQTATTAVPTGLPERIRMAAVLAAAALSGHNSKDVLTIDGRKESVIEKAIPKTVFELLGPTRAFRV